MSQRTRAHTTAAAQKPTKVKAPDETTALVETAPIPTTPTSRKSSRKTSASAEPVKPTVAPAEPVATPSAAIEETPEGLDAIAPLSSEALARLLRAVAAELERDPALARRLAVAMSDTTPPAESPPAAPKRTRAEKRDKAEKSSEAADEESVSSPIATIGRTFHPTIVTGITPELGAGVLDPFALRDRLGVDGLREALESLRLGSLRAIIREHHLDPSGRLRALNDAAKLRERIVQAATKKA